MNIVIFIYIVWDHTTFLNKPTKMAVAVNIVLAILLVLALISPLLEAARFGSRAKTLHLRSDKGKDDLGEGYVRIRRSEGLEFPVEEKLNREARSANKEERLGDEHDKAKVTKVCKFTFIIFTPIWPKFWRNKYSYHNYHFHIRLSQYWYFLLLPICLFFLEKRIGCQLGVVPSLQIVITQSV